MECPQQASSFFKFKIEHYGIPSYRYVFLAFTIPVDNFK
jgi:hypothetical protein